MGDYHTVHRAGAPGGYEALWKIGTAGDYRNVRCSQLGAIRHCDAGAQASIPSILQSEGSLFRFPFPDEDERSQDSRAFDDRRREPVRVGRPILEDLVTCIEHHIVQVRHGRSQSSMGCVFNAPCPLGPDGRKGRYQWIQRDNEVFVVGERRVDGRPVTVFACQCGRQFYLEASDMEHVHAPRELLDRIHAEPETVEASA